MPDIQVTLRGKKYDLPGIDTVQELQEQLSEKSGVESSKQGRVLFNGKRLAAEDDLADAGVKDGDQLNIVPKSKSKSSSSKTTTTQSVSSSTSSSASSSSAASGIEELLKGSSSGASGIEELLKGMGSGGLDDLMKNMGGEGAPSMQESMEMMSSMMNSPIFKEYMSDPEKLEESRQMILNNPMLKSMMAGMPGMEQLLSSPEAWKEAMQAAASMYQNMDQNELMQAMMGAAGGGGGMPGGGMPGLFDGNSNSLAALDELSEGED
jgi:uncharacterized ubiquitin-like protein YukD